MYSIDQVFNRGTGGVKRFLELMNSLIAAGHDVYLYSADEDALIKENNIKGRSIKSEKTSGNRSMVGLKTALGSKELFKEIKREKFDRVVAFDVRAAFSLVLNGVDNIYLFLRQDMMLYKKIQLEDTHTNKLKSLVVLAIARFTEALCLSRAKKIVVQCDFDLNGILKRHFFLRSGIRKKSVVQINNINPSWIVNSGKAHSVDPDSPRAYDLSFIGNFKDNRKGHDLLLPALRALSEEGTVVRTAIIGDGKHLDACKKEYADMENIHFLGRLSDPIPVVSSSNLLIVPSYVDSCPNTVMEGLYYGVPVIGANRSGIPEILNDPEWCFEMDVASIKNAIQKGLSVEYNRQLRNAQLKRREELLFDWGKKMVEIVES